MKTSVGFVALSCAPHKHDCYEIIFYRKGHGNFILKDKTIPISPGKFIIVPPNTVHASRYNDEAETIFTKGDFNHIFSFTSPAVVLDNNEKAGEFLVKMIFENRHANSEFLASLANALAHFLLQNIQTEKSISVTLGDIVTGISENFYDSTFDVGELLTKSGYAKDYIRAQFKLLTGKTPIEFLTEMRINHACYLIEIYGNSVPLTEIAEKCGFTDYVYFSRRFKQITGSSPKNYMKI